MKLVLKSYALLGRTIGQGQVTIDLNEGDTLRQVIDAIRRQFGADLSEYLLSEDGEICSDMLIDNNGVPVKSVDAPLTEGDLVLAMQPLGGG